MYYAYVLRSKTTGFLYKGSTGNLKARLQAHNAGCSRSTRNRGPWELVYYECFSSRSEAMKREKFFKSGKGRAFLQQKIEGKSG